MAFQHERDEMASILWRSALLNSTEYCEVAPTSGGHRISGVVLVAIQDRPATVRYSVVVDERWRSRVVEVTTTVGGASRRIDLYGDGEAHWRVSSAPAPALDGCLDVDLGFTPATNTLPIRRLDLDIGEAAAITAAWVRFPEFNIEAAEQSYERIEERLWRYRSGSFVADLTVDSSGLVIRYGADIWTMIARSD